MKKSTKSLQRELDFYQFGVCPLKFWDMSGKIDTKCRTIVLVAMYVQNELNTTQIAGLCKNAHCSRDFETAPPFTLTKTWDRRDVDHDLYHLVGALSQWDSFHDLDTHFSQERAHCELEYLISYRSVSQPKLEACGRNFKGNKAPSLKVFHVFTRYLELELPNTHGVRKPSWLNLCRTPSFSYPQKL